MEHQYTSPDPVSNQRPKNWLIEAILVTIFCCMPFGVVGIIYAAQVNNYYADGNYARALNASKEAERFTKLGFFISLALWVLSMIFLFLFGGWAFLQNFNGGD